ncbi:glutaredoxin 3 [Algimonas arctica]|uniref:Glutaredoxin n=1 Tax=Algimonas arctica TaxID=1479486 RepID=A0A8J3CSS8_9PROT|nr:glutaredoxin 3 [Algimonas arctica]GHB00588.1 glutaredoxin 3 [Algimonas arctica]
MAAKVEMYSKVFCPFCIRAQALLERKGVKVIVIPAANDKAKRAEMNQRSNGRNTFPQVFINGKHVGGSDELAALERAGKLDALLAG